MSLHTSASGTIASIETQDRIACERLIRSGSKSFYLASRLLPERVRIPTYALYAFCRVADDEVDEASENKLARVDSLHARLDRIFDGSPREHPVDRALTQVIEEHKLPRALLDALLDGFHWDAEARRYETLEELQGYCARVASTVGVMLTLLMGCRDPHTLARACDLGVAMQLTNIARDVGEDARAGRVYLPLRWLADAGLSLASLTTLSASEPRVAGVVARLLAEAQFLYRRADSGISRLPPDCRWSIAAARSVYAAIGEVIAHNEFDSISRRAVVSTSRKLSLVAGSFPFNHERASRFPTSHGEALAPPLPAAAFLVDAVVCP